MQVQNTFPFLAIFQYDSYKAGGRRCQDCHRYGLKVTRRTKNFTKTSAYYAHLDRGGTFTDVWASLPGKPDVVLKLLSVDPGNYTDAPTEGKKIWLS